jgi:hypothetical protein
MHMRQAIWPCMDIPNQSSSIPNQSKKQRTTSVIMIPFVVKLAGMYNTVIRIGLHPVRIESTARWRDWIESPVNNVQTLDRIFYVSNSR